MIWVEYYVQFCFGKSDKSANCKSSLLFFFLPDFLLFEAIISWFVEEEEEKA